MTRDEIEIEVVSGPEAAALAVARRLADAVRAGGHVVLTGGSTPKRAYALAAELEPDWSRVELWWGDERCVPPGDERSNYAMAKTALLDRLRLPPLAVHRMPGEAGKERGAERYDEELAALERFDLVLLGLGRDGHVASLYPRQPTLAERDRRAIGTVARLEPYVDRITLTVPMLARAREVLFLVVGEAKADAAARAFAGDPSPDTPGSLVRSALGTTRIVLDRAAAAQLESTCSASTAATSPRPRPSAEGR